MRDLNTPIWQLTIGEFLELQERFVPLLPAQTANMPEPLPKYVHGIKGLANLLGSSVATAQKIKSSGKIDKAVKQIGRKIIIDAELALKLINH